MYVCMYVYIFIYIYIYVCVCVCTYIHIVIYIVITRNPTSTKPTTLKALKRVSARKPPNKDPGQDLCNLVAEFISPEKCKLSALDSMTLGLGFRVLGFIVSGLRFQGLGFRASGF